MKRNNDSYTYAKHIVSYILSEKFKAKMIQGSWNETMLKQQKEVYYWILTDHQNYDQLRGGLLDQAALGVIRFCLKVGNGGWFFVEW